MVIQNIPTPMHYSGLSTDAKLTNPTLIPKGATFFEIDTGKFFIYNGTSWVIINP